MGKAKAGGPANVIDPKPTYLGLLNALSVAETAAEPIFTSWAAVTDDEQLADTLRFVGMREGEHGKAFAKRMLELGYQVRPQADADVRAAKSVKVAGSKKLSDVEKFQKLNFTQPPGNTDIFDGMFTDKNIDPTTGGLLGRYIAEERDSARRLAAEYERLSTSAQGNAAKGKSAKGKRAVKKKADKKKAA